VAEASALRDTLAECVLNRTGIKRPEGDVSIEVVASEMHGNMQIRQAIIESEAEVFLPMLIGQSLVSVPERLPVILVDDRGKVANCSDGGLFHLLVEAGHPTVAVDLRGYGETQTTNWSNRDRRGGFVAQLLGVESMGYGYGARHTGHTLIGMRIFDLLQTIRALPHLGFSREVVLIGRGGCGIQALHAAVLSDAVTAVCTWRGLSSYLDVVRGSVYHVRFYDMVPNVTTAYDLPHLSAALAPRPVALVNAVDERLDVCESAKIEADYALTSEAYANLKAEKGFLIETQKSEGEEVASIVNWLAEIA